MKRRSRIALALSLAAILKAAPASASGVGLPSNHAGLGLGNLERFDGVRLNLRDRDVERVRGVNLALWTAGKNEKAEYLGLSVGLVPSGGRLSGVNLGLLGAGAERELRGVTVGLLGAGAGNDISGLIIGGLGCGAGRNLRGIVIGGLGAGTGDDLVGIAVGGLGCGAGKNARGLVLGGLGCGVGENLDGIALGGLGCGAGKRLRGVAIGGLGVGAGDRAEGLLLGGYRVEAKEIRGICLAAHTRVRPGGSLVGLAGGLFNQVRGDQTGVTIGLFNYARRLRGLQIGGVNWVRSNPAWRRVLPVVNW